jgi:hypothetical protein
VERRVRRPGGFGTYKEQTKETEEEKHTNTKKQLKKEERRRRKKKKNKECRGSNQGRRKNLSR